MRLNYFSLVFKKNTATSIRLYPSWMMPSINKLSLVESSISYHIVGLPWLGWLTIIRLLHTEETQVIILQLLRGFWLALPSARSSLLITWLLGIAFPDSYSFTTWGFSLIFWNWSGRAKWPNNLKISAVSARRAEPKRQRSKTLDSKVTK